MTANYKQTNATGSMWTRCKQIHINNPLGQMPSVQMAEEDAVSIGDKVMTQPGRVINGSFSPQTVFDLVNPDTGDVIGQSSHMQVYVILHSLWLSMAKAQDAIHDMINTPPTVGVIATPPTVSDGGDGSIDIPVQE